MRNKLYILKPIAVILIVALLWQSISWANPEIAQKKTASQTLQVPSFFLYSQDKHILEAVLVELVKLFPDVEDFNFRLMPRIDGRIIEIDFSQKYKENEKGEKDEEGKNLIVPCLVTSEKQCKLYKAVITPDKNVSLRGPIAEITETDITVYDFYKFLRTEFKATRISPEDISRKIKMDQAKAIPLETIKRHLKILARIGLVVEWKRKEDDKDYMVINKSKAELELFDPTPNTGNTTFT